MRPGRPQDADRRRELAAIHATAAQLGLDTSDRDPGCAYRLLLQAQAGVSSAADADAAGRRRVLAYLRRQAGQAAPREVPRDGWQAEKMRTLWARLGAAGALTDPSEQGLLAFTQALTGVAALRWLDTRQGNRVIEALKAWCARKGCET